MRSVRSTRANPRRSWNGRKRLHNAHYQVQGYADGVVLLQKGKLVSTLCDRIQGALNCVENCSREIGLSINADKTTMVLFTNNRMIFIILDFLVLN
jgi:hypothetical protein